MSSVFAGVEKATASRGGPYLVPGIYDVLNVSSLKEVDGRKGDQFFCVEFEILQSRIDAQPNGTRTTWMPNFKHDATLGNVRQFISILMNIDFDTVDEDTCKKMVDEEKQPGRNRIIRCEAVNITTKAGNPFTKPTWYALGEEKQAEVEQLRKEAGFAPF